MAIMSLPFLRPTSCFLLLLLLSQNASAARWDGQVLARIDEYLSYSMRAPVDMVRRAQVFLRIGGFGDRVRLPSLFPLHGMFRDKIIQWLRMEDIPFSLYFGLEDGTFMNYGQDYTDISYREPGESGYAAPPPPESDMFKHYISCVNRFNGSEENCTQAAGAPYVKCIHDCQLAPCGIDSPNEGNDMFDETSDALCPQYTIETAQENDMIGFVPRSYACVDLHGAYVQIPGKVLQNADTGELGNCYYGDGTTMAQRTLYGDYEYCGYEYQNNTLTKLSCDDTFIGQYRSRDYDPRARGWYRDTKRTLRSFWATPYPYFSRNVIGITYSEPMYEQQQQLANGGTPAWNKNATKIFRGVWAVDFELDFITEFLKSNYGSSETRVLIVEANGDQNYIIATSTGAKISRLVYSNNRTRPCNDQESSLCTAVRVPVAVLATSESPDDRVLWWAFDAHRQDDFVSAYDFVRRTFQEPDSEPGTTAYNSEARKFEVVDSSNLEWIVIAAVPMSEDDNNVAVPGTSSFALIIFMAFFGFVTCLGMFILFRQFRHQESVQLVDWRFTCGFLLVCAFLNLSSLTLLGENTDETCMLRRWAFNTLFASALSPLFVKVYRLSTLIEAGSNFRRKTISHGMAVIYTVPICAIELLILLVFSLVDPPHAEDEFVTGPDEDEQRVKCTTESSAFFITQLSYYGALIFVGCYLSYRSRNLDKKYSEATPLALAMYNIAFTGTLFLIITEVVDMDPIHRKVLRAVGVLWGTIFSSLVFPLPRLLKIGAASNDDNNMSDRLQSIRANPPSSLNSGHNMSLRDHSHSVTASAPLEPVAESDLAGSESSTPLERAADRVAESMDGSNHEQERSPSPVQD